MIFQEMNNEPVLITLEGDGYEPLRDILNDDDYNYLLGGNDFNEDDVDYYAEQYPELMGVAPVIIAKIGSGIASIVGRIAKRIRARRARRAGVSPTPLAPVQGPQPAQGRNVQYNPHSGYRGGYPMRAPMMQAKSSNNDMLIYAGVAGLVMYMMMSKKKTKKGGK